MQNKRAYSTVEGKLVMVVFKTFKKVPNISNGSPSVRMAIIQGPVASLLPVMLLFSIPRLHT